MTEPEIVVGGVAAMRADMSASLAGMTATPRKRAGKVTQPALIDTLPMTPEARRDRAKKANAALTTEQRSAAGKARAAMLHHPANLIQRGAAGWAELSDAERAARLPDVRKALREAGIIK